jgi:hypothetical protein
MAKLSARLSLGYCIAQIFFFGRSRPIGQLMIRRINHHDNPITQYAITYKMPTDRMQESVSVLVILADAPKAAQRPSLLLLHAVGLWPCALKADALTLEFFRQLQLITLSGPGLRY